nr:hypothetical protein [Tanacetum cinerariifolium]
VKYPIIDWEIHTEGSRTYWKIIRVGGITKAYQSFKDLLKGFNKEELVALWNLVKEKFNANDVLWKLQRYIIDPLTWKLYTDCGVHHVSSTRGHNIFMLTEKDYPLSNAVMILMLSGKLQVEKDNEMTRDLVMNIFKETNKPKSKNSSQQQSKSKDKGKGIMVEPKKPFKKKDQIMMDAEVAKNLEAQMQAELEEKEMKVRSAMRVESSTESSLGDQEDASKQGRMIDNIDQDVEITLVDDIQGSMNEEDMFEVNDLDGDKVVVDVLVSEKVEQSVKAVE